MNFLTKGLCKERPSDEHAPAAYAMKKVFNSAHEAYVRSNGRCQVFLATYLEGLATNALVFQGQFMLGRTHASILCRVERWLILLS